jgi:uncharacterized protein (TIGR01777 family)
VRVLVTGATGLIGSALSAALREAGHSVLAVSRRPAAGPDTVSWDWRAGRLDPDAVAGVDAAVHLAGENLAAGRWSPARLRQMHDSRVVSGALLASTIARVSPRPRVLVSVSAIGIYGDRGEQMLDDGAAPGLGVLPRLVRDWEASADAARTAGVRVAHPRFGLVLSARGGALAELLRPARWGLLGPLGSGRQWWSWITLRDAVRVLMAALTDGRWSGPFNAVSAAPVRQRAFAHALGHVLHRPSWVAAPELALRVALGGMADEMLLASQRVVPGRLTAAGFAFADPALEPALRTALADRA